MGLDMYAFTTTEKPPAPADFEISQSERLHYWRKHPDLHGWMEALYREKHGSAESFNWVNLALAADDLDRLEADIRKSADGITEDLTTDLSRISGSFVIARNTAFTYKGKSVE